ncbi:MAG: hypothetical protein IVW57_10580 [Ktedonobacterales bacterium]|nr:hypothetical protein [Ktedonobacterales bacterium]
MELDEMSRREFFQLAATAGVTFAAAKVTIMEATKRGGHPPPIGRYREIDLDTFSIALNGWAAAISHGHDLSEGLAAVSQLDARLRKLQSYGSDVRFAEARLRSAELLAALQEAIYPWRKERPRTTIATYEGVMNAVFGDMRMPKTGFGPRYVRLVARHAVLRRENEQAWWCAHELNALDDRLIQATNDPVFEVAYACQRLHTLAIQNKMYLWRNESDAVRVRVEHMRVDTNLREELHAIVDYTMGVGLKGFAWHLTRERPSSPMIERYAAEACEHFARLRAGGRGGLAVRHINLYHPAITAAKSAPEFEAAEIDALVWCAPDEAIRRATLLRPRAEQLYPAVVRKLDDDIHLAQRRRSSAR